MIGRFDISFWEGSMKRLLGWCTCVTLVFAFGCGDKKTEKKTETTNGGTKTTETTTTEK